MAKYRIDNNSKVVDSTQVIERLDPQVPPSGFLQIFPRIRGCNNLGELWANQKDDEVVEIIQSSGQVNVLQARKVE